MPRQRPNLTTCIVLSAVAIVGFIGVRSVKPFLEGYWAYSGRGSLGGQISRISGYISAFRKDHGGKPPSPVGMWDILTCTSDSAELGDVPATGKSFGPYLPFVPKNPLNGSSVVADKPAPGVGWVYQVSGTDFTFSAVNVKGDAVMTKDETHLYYFRPSERAHVAAQRALNNWGGLLFGIPLLVYLFAPSVLRSSQQSRRKAQGLCVHCGYDLRAHHVGQVCPECGELILK